MYGPYARQVKEVLERYTPEVRTASIDEFFLDFRGCEGLWSDPADVDEDATIERVVAQMRAEIGREVGLPASAGIGSTRAVAKIASGQAKPAGLRMVRWGEEIDFVGPLQVGRYPGIGPVAEQKLTAAGIFTLGQLLDLPAGPLRGRFRSTVDMVRRGIDGRRGPHLGADRPAFREHDVPGQGMGGSISNERTFHADVGDRDRVCDQLRNLAERVCWRARRRGVRARTVTLKLRTADFRTVTRARTGWPTHTEDEVFATLLQLLPLAWSGDRAVRLVGVVLSSFVGEDRQLPLPLGFEARPPPGEAIDAIRERFGYEAIRLGTGSAPSSSA